MEWMVWVSQSTNHNKRDNQQTTTTDGRYKPTKDNQQTKAKNLLGKAINLGAEAKNHFSLGALA